MDCERCKHYWNNGKDEYCDKRGWDFKRIDCPDFASKYKPKTNYDLLIRKTPKELAEWIADDLIEPGYNSREQTVKMWLDWLKQEADNE